MCSATATTIGHTVGTGDFRRIRQEGRTLSVILFCWTLLGGLLYILREPCYLSMINSFCNKFGGSIDDCYECGHGRDVLSDARWLRNYPRWGRYSLRIFVNLISTWFIVIPLSLAGAFVWKLSVVQVVMLLQSDQIFKAIPAFSGLKVIAGSRN